jgi:hypothetical protein
MNKFCVCGLAMASAILWGTGTLVVGLVNRFHPDYGLWYLKMLQSIYPGFVAAYGLKNLLIGVLYSLADGAICGALFALLYNGVVKKCCCGKEKEEGKTCC